MGSGEFRDLPFILALWVSSYDRQAPAAGRPLGLGLGRRDVLEYIALFTLTGLSCLEGLDCLG